MHCSVYYTTHPLSATFRLQPCTPCFLRPQGLSAALADAQLHLDRAWAELSHDFARAAAMRPPGSTVRAFRSCAKGSCMPG